MTLEANYFRRRIAAWYALAMVMLSAAGCSTPSLGPGGAAGRAFPEAELLFHREPRWLGADAALSVSLGSDRTLWLFGDTFVAKTNAHVRTESELVRNTLALQTGRDASYGFGASTIGMRTAPALTGPWSAPVVVYHPPESAGPRPFVYAAKAHPELVANDATDLVVTYGKWGHMVIGGQTPITP